MFLVFEGIDGSGKSTQAKMLAEALRRDAGADVLLVREPGGTPLGEQIRGLVLDPDWGSLDPETELFLFMAARSHLVRKVVAPALAEGRVVISDRFLWSSVVYQSVGAGPSMEDILKMGGIAIGEVEVARTFIIDVEPEIAFERVKVRNRMENRGLEFQRSVRAGFLRLAERFSDTTSVVDGGGSPEEVFARVFACLPGGSSR